MPCVVWQHVVCCYFHCVPCVLVQDHSLGGAMRLSKEMKYGFSILAVYFALILIFWNF